MCICILQQQQQQLRHNVYAHLYLFHFLAGKRLGKISLAAQLVFQAQLNLNLTLQQQPQSQQLKAIVDLMPFAANGSAAGAAAEAIDLETLCCPCCLLGKRRQS